MKAKKQITIDALAGMVHKRIHAVDRIAALETDMQHLTARVVRLEQKSGLIKK